MKHYDELEIHQYDTSDEYGWQNHHVIVIYRAKATSESDLVIEIESMQVNTVDRDGDDLYSEAVQDLNDYNLSETKVIGLIKADLKKQGLI